MFSGLMSKQYKSRISEQQKLILLEFIEVHRELVSGYLTKNFNQSDKVRLWNEITNILNTCAGGGIKDAENWKGCWGDLKSGVKKKLSKLKLPEDGTSPITPLNSFEERVAALMGIGPGCSGEGEADDTSDRIMSYTVVEGIQQDTAVSSGTQLKEEQESCHSETYVVPECLSRPSPSTTGYEIDDSTTSLNMVCHVDATDEAISSPMYPALKRRRLAMEEAEAAVGSCANAQTKQAAALEKLAEIAAEYVSVNKRKLESQETNSERKKAAEEAQAASKEKRMEILERKISAMERRAAAEERRVAAEERRVATEERRMAAEERKVLVEERRLVVEERKVTAEERKAATLERIESLLMSYMSKGS